MALRGHEFRLGDEVGSSEACLGGGLSWALGRIQDLRLGRKMLGDCQKVIFPTTTLRKGEGVCFLSGWPCAPAPVQVLLPVRPAVGARHQYTLFWCWILVPVPKIPCILCSFNNLNAYTQSITVTIFSGKNAAPNSGPVMFFPEDWAACIILTFPNIKAATLENDCEQFCGGFPSTPK